MAADLTVAARGRVDVRPTAVWTSLAVLGSFVGFALAFWLAPSSGTDPGRALTVLLLFGYTTHVASTGWFLTRRDLRSIVGRSAARLAGICVVAGLVAGSALTLHQLEWALLAYFGWQFVHFNQQNLGMLSLVARSESLPTPDRLERSALRLVGAGGVSALVLHPGLLQLDVDHQLQRLFPVAALVSITGMVLGVVAVGRRASSPRYIAASAVGWWFFVPVLVFDNPYVAVAGLTIAHSWQYLWLMSHVASRSPGSGGTSTTGVGAMLSVATVGGLALAQIADRPESPGLVGRVFFGLYLGLVMAHFALDRTLWRSGTR